MTEYRSPRAPPQEDRCGARGALGRPWGHARRWWRGRSTRRCGPGPPGPV